MASAEDDALIARLMAEDAGYDQDYGDDGGGDDSDYDPDYGAAKKKPAKKGGRKGGRGKKAAAAAAAAAPAAPAQPTAPTGAPQQQLLQQWPGGAPPLVAVAPGGLVLQGGIPMQQAALVDTSLLVAAGPPQTAAAAAAAAAAANAGSVQQDGAGEEFSATGRRKRKDTGRQRQQSRSWSDEEERLFLEALELHGRDWKRCAEHVGSRDHRAFTSHAQKHFVKLLLRGEEVPAKVAETGRGYTLSGKPLDPNSSSAAAYGLKKELFEEVVRTGKLEEGVHVTTFDMSEAAAGAARKAGGGKAKGGGGSPDNSAGPPPAKRPRGKGRAKAGGGEGEDAGGTDEDAEAYAALAAGAAPGERTEYARNRPRREVGQRARLGDTTESLELTHLQEFVGPPGTGAPLAQPFSVVVESQALLVADFHAHLSRCEVIGLLGGTFDSERRVMEIKEAYPCRRVAGSDSGTSVELDAESQVEATSAMEERGLVPVGWYHSHPIFEPRPSAKDNENQRNYQALCRDAATGLEPWVGLIVGPYDHALESPASTSQLWVVKMHGGALAPFGVRHTVRVAMPEEHVQQKIEEALEQLQEDIGRVDLAERWRGFSHLVHGQPGGPALSKIQKLRASLLQHLPKDQPEAVAAFLDGVTRSIEASWGVSLAAAAAAGEEQQQLAAAPAVAAEAAAVPAAGALPQTQHAAAPAGGVLLPAVAAPPLAAPGGPPQPAAASALKAGPAGGLAAGLPPNGMSMLLAGVVGPPAAAANGHGGLVITAAHHQLLAGNGHAVPASAQQH